jgi:Xaa-Pro aminopeptidase
MRQPESVRPSRVTSTWLARDIYSVHFSPALAFIFPVLLGLLVAIDAQPQEARRRWEMMAQIRRDKFDQVLPEAMRENGIDMWITVMKEGYADPLYEDLGRGSAGYLGHFGYYVFTDRGEDRIERAVLGIGGKLLARSGAYDIMEGNFDLRTFVAERDPQRIGVNMSKWIGAADGLSLTAYEHLVSTLGELYASRLVSAEKLISDFRSRRVATEIIAFGEAGELSRHIAERALSNEVITPGVTTLEDVAWWMQEQLFVRGLESSFGLPSVYIIGPEGIEAMSTDRIIHRGDLLTIDWGVGLMNLRTDMKRIAYVLEEGETTVPPGIQNAFEQALKAREIIRDNISVGRSGGATLELLNSKLEEAGFIAIGEKETQLALLRSFNLVNDNDATEVIIVSHSIGNLGHGIGPSIASFNPRRMEFEIRPTNLFVIELFAWTPAPEWDGKKVHIHLEDSAVATERGIEWLYPVIERILLIK